MKNENNYCRDEVVRTIGELFGLISGHLDNRTGLPNKGISEGDTDMPKRQKEKVIVDGSTRWVTGGSMQAMMDSYVDLLKREGKIEDVPYDETVPTFGEYQQLFYETYKQNQQSNTVVNRKRLLRNHILPEFGAVKIDKIHTTMLQRWFNALAKKYSHETIVKLRNIMNPVFDSAVEDGYMARNPLSSKRLEILGKETVSHKAIPKDKMAQIKMEVKELPWKEKAMCGLLCYTGMRYEEVLGIRWEDLDEEWLVVRRAVVHPNRNLPEVKPPKTKSSERMIPLHPELKALLADGKKRKGFILHTDKDPRGETPMSYTEARRVFDKIRKRFDISEYSAHDFRDTCATEWRENGMALDVLSRILGHSKTETTEKRYVKYRTELLDEARKLM